MQNMQHIHFIQSKHVMVQKYERYMYVGKVQGNNFLLTVNHWQTGNFTLRINNVFEYVKIHRKHHLCKS